MMSQKGLRRLVPQLLKDSKYLFDNISNSTGSLDPEGYYDNGNSLDINVITLGGSAIAGVGINYHKDGYIRYFSEALETKTCHNIRWKAYAKAGYKVKDIYQKLIPSITEEKVDYITMGIGWSDGLNMTNPNTWREYLIKIFDRLNEKFPTSQIIILHLPPFYQHPFMTELQNEILGQHIFKLEKELIDICISYENIHYPAGGVDIYSYVDTRVIEKFDISLLYSDEFHPSTYSYQLWADNMVEILKANNMIKHQCEDEYERYEMK